MQLQKTVARELKRSNGRGGLQQPAELAVREITKNNGVELTGADRLSTGGAA